MEEQNPQGMQALIPEAQGPQGPVFEPGPGWGAKLKKNFTKIVLPLIAIAVVAVGLVMFLGQDGEEMELSLPETKTSETLEVTLQKITTQEGQTENIYKVAAQPGDGITHLARKTLKEYLNANPSANSGLTTEHKIYIEDYLKDLRGEKFLEIGEEIEFSENEITKAIEMAKNLSENQLANLSQFVPLVSGL